MGKKKYVFITSSINMVGGIQFWLVGKTKYLESQGWDVYVLFSDIGKHEHAVVSSLDKYLGGQIPGLALPPCVYPKLMRERIFRKMEKIVTSNGNVGETIIETHSPVGALWAEPFAERLNGKHVMFICNEKYHGLGTWYDPFIDFFDFKHRRKELAGEVNGEIQKLFADYKTVTPKEDYIFLLDDDPVHDAVNEKVERLVRKDLNICYIGRPNKSYVPNVLEGVAKFSKNHTDKDIHFIIVGDCSEIRSKITDFFSPLKNVTITELGNVVPIPKSLFAKTDVVIAGSGSARCAVYAGVPTILANPDTNLASGLLGYDIHGDYIFCKTEIEGSFDKQLERVFIDKVQEKMPFDFIPKQGPDVCTIQNLQLIRDSANNKEYYPSELLMKTKYLDWRNIIRLYSNHFLSLYFPSIKRFIKKL
jgi:hypothetical protein